MISGETPLVAFVSSRQSDDTNWARTATVEVLEQPDWLTPWLFEQTPPSSARLSDSYLSKVRSSDLVIWLVDHHTSAPVTKEIAAALETHRRMLVFRISPPPSDPATESLLARVGTKWAYVVDSMGLTTQLRLALQDELIRTWRAAGRSTTTPVLDLLHDRSRSRCIDRWLAAGLPEELAVALADDPSVGMLQMPVFASGRFVILRAEIGAGKSLVAERLFQDALRCARTSPDEKPPVFLEASNIAGSLGSCLDLESHTGAPYITNDDRLLLVIDGLDEVAPDRRAPLARAARRITREWTGARVLITSRPLSDLSPDFEEAFVDVPPLSPERTLALMTRVAGRRIRDSDIWSLPRSLREAVARPLFAILLALYQREERLASVPTGRLLSTLVTTSLGRVSASENAALPLLRKLGRLVINNGGAPVRIADVATYTEAAPLFRSRLVVERNGRVAFPLMILAEWFAARDLESRGAVALDGLVNDTERLRSWLVPLAMCVSDTSEENLSLLLSTLASRRPAVAASVLADAFSEWSFGGAGGGPLPSWQRLGDGLRNGMASWVEGVAAIAPYIAPVHSDGTVRMLGIRIEGSSVVVSWARERSTQTVVQLPHPSSGVAGVEWLRTTLRNGVVNDQGLYWLWTLDDLRCRLSELLERRALPVARALEEEFRWRAALSVLGRGSLDRRPIGRTALLEGLRLYRRHERYSTAGEYIHVEQVCDAVAHLLGEGEAGSVSPPWPGPERLVGRYMWSGYSPEAVLARATAVYAAALDAYLEMVDCWFPRFRDDLELSSRQPLRVVGMVATVPDEDDQGPSMWWYVEPGTTGARCEVNLSLGNRSEQRRFVERAENELRSGSFSYTMSALSVFSVDAAETLAYSWLREDLRSVHWVR